MTFARSKTASETTRRWLLRVSMLAVVSAAVVPLGGCRLCSNCEMDDYSAYGGINERTRRDGGRVGSIFDPGGVKMATLVNRDEPMSAEEIERQRQSEDPDAIKAREAEKAREADDAQREADSEDNEADREKRDKERDRKLDELELDDIEVSYEAVPLPLLN